MSSGDFSSVPILDYSQALSPSTRAKFIADLRDAAINVGFLYLSHTPVSPDVTKSVISYIPAMFSLPEDEKERIRMRNSPHFLGYSKFGAEFTKGQADMREQFDIATKHECQWKEGDPQYRRLWGPSQWPNEDLIPGFQKTLETYLDQVQHLADEFVTLLAEAIGLGPDGLAKFYDTAEKMQHRSKVVKYPAAAGPSASTQGVGPHYDAGFVTIVRPFDFDLNRISPHDSCCKRLTTRASRCKTCKVSGLTRSPFLVHL